MLFATFLFLLWLRERRTGRNGWVARRLCFLVGVVEFCFQNFDNFIDRIFFEVCAFDKLFPAFCQYAFRRGTTDAFQCLDDPFVDFVFEFIEIDIFFLAFVYIPVYIDRVTGEHAGEFYVEAAFSYRERYLFGFEEYFCLFLFFVEAYRRYFGRVQCPLYKERGIGRIVDDVDIFITQFPYDTVDTRTFYSDAGTDRVDTLVIRLYGNFCAFAGNAGDFVYRDEAVVYLGNFEFEKTA